MEWRGVERSGVERSGAEWSGVEWCGVVVVETATKPSRFAHI